MKSIVKKIKKSKREYYNEKLIEKSNSLNNQLNFRLLYMISIVILFYSINNSKFEGFDLGFFEIKDADLLNKLIPLGFAYLLLDFVLLLIHKEEISDLTDILSQKLFVNGVKIKNIKLSNRHFYFSDKVSKLIRPFSYQNEINEYLSEDGKNAKLGNWYINLLNYFRINTFSVLSYLFFIKTIINLFSKYDDLFSIIIGVFSIAFAITPIFIYVEKFHTVKLNN